MKPLHIAMLAGCAAAALGATALAQGKPDAHGFVRMQESEMKWVPYAGDTDHMGLQAQYLIGDPNKPGPYVMRLKFPPHTMSTPHSHGEDRVGTVIKGTWWTGDSAEWDPTKTVPVRQGGVMLHPHGAIHYDGARDEEVIVQLAGTGPTSKVSAHKEDHSFRQFK